MKYTDRRELNIIYLDNFLQLFRSKSLFENGLKYRTVRGGGKYFTTCGNVETHIYFPGTRPVLYSFSPFSFCTL